MFNFFANLAVSIYYGEWLFYSNSIFVNGFIRYLKKVPIFGLFNNSTEAFYNTSTDLSISVMPDLVLTIAVILSTICCIMVFWLIVKALWKLITFWKA